MEAVPRSRKDSVGDGSRPPAVSPLGGASLTWYRGSPLLPQEGTGTSGVQAHLVLA